MWSRRSDEGVDVVTGRLCHAAGKRTASFL
jgi:hypothetical protein